jgi:hypothetical protein
MNKVSKRKKGLYDCLCITPKLQGLNCRLKVNPVLFCQFLKTVRFKNKNHQNAFFAATTGFTVFVSTTLFKYTSILLYPFARITVASPASLGLSLFFSS